MKPITSMSPEEHQDLIAYNIGDISLYYSNISTVTKDSVIYNQKSLDSIDPKHLKAIKAGKARYEAYKLFSTSINVEDYIIDKADEVINKRYFETLSASIVKVEEGHKALVKELVKQIKLSKETSEQLINTTDSVVNLYHSTSEQLSQVDFTSMTKSVKDLSKLLKPSITEFDDTIAKLKSLFK